MFLGPLAYAFICYVVVIEVELLVNYLFIILDFSTENKDLHALDLFLLKGLQTLVTILLFSEFMIAG